MSLERKAGKKDSVKELDFILEVPGSHGGHLSRADLF